jgi:hypothetical protein
MSSLRFTQAPPRPNHISAEVWEREWAGLMVGLASVFPLEIGYLGQGQRRIFDDTKKIFRDATATDSMNYLTNKLCNPMWVSRGALIHACRYSSPPRLAILAWLEEESQRGREMFAVPDSVAEYLP